MEENYSFKKIFIRGIISGIVFTALWSTWAYYANLAHRAELAKKASITQGSFTIINAFIYTILVEYLFSIGKTKFVRIVLAFVLPNILVTILLTSLHHLRGTPNVLATVTPSLTIIYALSLIYVLVIGPRKLKSGLDAAVS